MDDFDRAWASRHEQRALEGRYEDPPPRTKPPLADFLFTAREFCEMEVPPSEPLVGGFLHRGARLVVGGPKGQGKTTFVFQMIAAAVFGRKFLGFDVEGGRRALILDAEQGHRTIVRRLTEAGLHETDAVKVLHQPAGLELDRDPYDAGDLERILEAGRFDIVVLDPLYKLHAGNPNDEREAVDLMKIVDRWREHYRFGLTIPAHTRKAKERQPFSMDDISGNTALIRGAETVVGLQRVSPGMSRLHIWADRDDLEVGAKWDLLFHKDTGFIRDEREQGPTVADQLRDLLEAVGNKGLTMEQIRGQIEAADSTLGRALKQVGAVGMSIAGGKKLWRMPVDDAEVERLTQLAMGTDVPANEGEDTVTP